MIIENNYADDGGGIYDFGGNSNTPMHCSNVIIRNNEAYNGSAIVVKGTNTIIENALIIDNGWNTNEGGNVINIQGNGIFINITLANNKSAMAASPSWLGFLKLGSATLHT